ncbi:TIM barrel protein [Burkholderia sp. BCC1630]|uniref:sugar phosphate isomerase/epimerase family protein n=1 Tax=Burkholderia sp. BCC1630 TaxID=2676304 RepID=UPI00158F0967|nr:TIM barrel protein [Burkholderia sp. BCC1630]
MKYAINDGTLRTIDDYGRRLSILNEANIGGIGVWESEISNCFSNFEVGLSDLKILLDQHEVEVVEVNFIKTLFQKKWSNGPLEEAKQICETAVALNCPLITVATFCESIDWEIGAKSLQQLADFARDYGLKVAVEFLPWTGVPDIHSAVRLLDDCRRDNVGILLDTFHFFESGGGSWMIYQESMQK